MDVSNEWCKKNSECIAAALEEKNSLLSKEMTLHPLWKHHHLYDKKGMVENEENILKRSDSTLTVLDNYDGNKSSESDNDYDQN